MNNQSISFVINTKNSAATIVRTLQSIRQIADEIIVVDMQSTDKTVELAKKYTDRIFSHKDVGYVEPARNFAVGKAKSDWIMVIDADEEISTGLRDFIIQLKDDRIAVEMQADSYFIPRKNIVFDKWIEHTGWWPDYQLRLFRSGRVEWLEQIHSIPMTTGKTIELPANEKYCIIHHNYQTIEQFIDRLNRYTSVEAENDSKFDLEETLDSYFDEMLSRMFAHDGLADGVHGVGLSLLQANYQLVAGLKKWQAQGFKNDKNADKMAIKVLNRFKRRLNYWVAYYYFSKSSGLAKIFWQVRRKLKI